MPEASPRKTVPTERKLSKRGQQTEQRFLDAANEVFWSHGFAEAKIAQILAEGDLSVGSFYHLFADKSELLERASERLLANFHTIFARLDLSRETNVDAFTLL